MLYECRSEILVNVKTATSLQLVLLVTTGVG